MEIHGPNPNCPTIFPIGKTLTDVISKSPRGSIFRAAVGYISESGVSQISESLSKLIKQNGSTEIIIGLNQLTSSAIKASETLFNLCGQSGVYVQFGLNEKITFHPKIYWVSGNSKGVHLWIGSSNFTGSGFNHNYECNLYVKIAPKTNESLIKEINDYFTSIRINTYCLPLTADLIAELKTLPVSKSESPAQDLPPDVRKRLNLLFKQRLNKRPKISKPAFVMTLANNDVSGRRGEPYFLIPVIARDLLPNFWLWPFPTPAIGFPNIKIQADIKIGPKNITENRRIYFVKDRTEFRFVSPTIYKLGQSFVGSLLLIEKMLSSYTLTIIPKTDKRFPVLVRYATNIASRQKTWGYIT
jgi:HKD family nuclease